ncbi:MAG: hypothetical protein RL173_365 [Fibrobacterota bacterium]|jgi:hypothetical protein
MERIGLLITRATLASRTASSLLPIFVKESLQIGAVFRAAIAVSFDAALPAASISWDSIFQQPVCPSPDKPCGVPPIRRTYRLYEQSAHAVRFGEYANRWARMYEVEKLGSNLQRENQYVSLHTCDAISGTSWDKL